MAIHEQHPVMRSTAVMSSTRFPLRPRGVLAAGLALSAVAMVVACGRSGERIAGPERSVQPVTRVVPPAPKPTASPAASSGATGATATTATVAVTVERASTLVAGDGPFGWGPGRGSIAPAPPPGPLVDGARGPARPAVVVKIDNLDAAWPQAGINQADITFELLVEGVSRFAAVFNSEDAALVGPVRSARTSDVNLLSMLDWPCFAFSGGNDPVLQAVGAGALVDVSATVAAAAYARAEDREMPHNLMTSSSALRNACSDGGAPGPLFDYGAGPGDRGAEVGGVALAFGASVSRFVWDAPSGRWLRYVDGYAQVDTAGVQVSPVNVVVLATDYLPSPADPRSPEAQTLGSGEAWVLVDGRAVSGTWERSSATQPYLLAGDDGAPLILRPGRTWVALAPSGSAELIDRG